MRTLPWRYLGVQPYQEVWDLQETVRARILVGEENAARLFLTQHPPTISLGRAERGQNLKKDVAELTEGGFDVVETNRGGKVTYHGPGQLVAYPVIDLRTFRMGVKQYVHALEETMIQTLRSWEIAAERREHCPGAWVKGRKIGSVGIHVRKQVSVHGLALNISSDLSHFDVMNPCGFSDIQMTSVQKEGAHPTWDDVLRVFTDRFSKAFQVDLIQEEFLAPGLERENMSLHA